MLATSARRSLGTIPYFTSVDHARWARDQIGPDKDLIADSPASSTRTSSAPGRRPVSTRALPRPHELHERPAQHGFDQEDLEDGGTDRLIDPVIPHGSAADIAAAARAHREAGANQVCFQPLGTEGIPAADWQALAAAVA